MRWSNLDVTADQRAKLPGYRDEAVVRHFDAPEAIATRFYEVRAKSVLNRVPDASQVPFRWTINPYRGCTHACTYCLDGDTPVLRADGRHTPIAELEVGDRIYGTVLEGRYRRYVTTTVLDRWTSLKPAWRVVLEDGTELIASGDHRFLTERGFKHVAPARDGPQRPYLTTNNELLGTGAFAAQPQPTSDYRHGYLYALAHARISAEPRGAGSATAGQRARPRSIESEALQRAREFLAQDRLAASGCLASRAVAEPVAAGVAAHAMTGLDVGHEGLSLVGLAEQLPAPGRPGLDWCRGFLAGIFDADGARSGGVLRISGADARGLAQVQACARRLGFDTVLERRPGVGAATVRIRGGLIEQLRFLHVADPAVIGKRDIEGIALKSRARLRVVAVEPLGCVLPLYDITTGTGDFIANGVVSHNCFARPTHEYLGFDAGRDFEREIVVKVNAPERLAVELARPSWQREHVALGTNTDPYQWVEGRYRLMRGIWAALRDARNPCSVLTKSPLLLRDLDLMRELDACTEFSAALSVPTLDEKAWRATEPRTPHPRARLEALAELTRAGIRTGLLVAPLMPGINDAPEQVEPILQAAAEAGAAYVTGVGLHLRRGVRAVFMEWLAAERPELVARYRALYGQGAYLPPSERKRLSGMLHGPDLPPGLRMARGLEVPAPTAMSAAKSAQEALF